MVEKMKNDGEKRKRKPECRLKVSFKGPVPEGIRAGPHGPGLHPVRKQDANQQNRAELDNCLVKAVKEGNTTEVSRLLDLGANPLSSGKDGRFAFEFARTDEMILALLPASLKRLDHNVAALRGSWAMSLPCFASSLNEVSAKLKKSKKKFKKLGM